MMPSNETLPGRLVLARLALQARKGELSQAAFAAAVSAHLPEGEPMNQTRVSRMLRGTEPSLAEVFAIARACAVDPGWLAFGPASEAPRPKIVDALLSFGPLVSGDAEAKINSVVNDVAANLPHAPSKVPAAKSAARRKSSPQRRRKSG